MTRKCLGCDLDFRSEGIHNRLCRSCGDHAKRRDNIFTDETMISSGSSRRKKSPVHVQSSDWKVEVKANVGA